VVAPITADGGQQAQRIEHATEHEGEGAGEKPTGKPRRHPSQAIVCGQ